jgi:hypothetical protein
VILTITLNGLISSNAFNGTMQKELIDAFDAADRRQRQGYHRHRRGRGSAPPTLPAPTLLTNGRSARTGETPPGKVD